MATERLVIASAIAIFFSVTSLLCSIINVILIYVMKQWNGFLAVLWSMAFCQILYDATFYLSYDTHINSTATAVWGCCQAFGGLSVTFWTNVLSAVVFHVISQRTRFNILESFWKLSFVVYFPAAAISFIEIGCTLKGLQQCKYIMTEIYYWARLASIAFNFLVFGYIYAFVRSIRDRRGNQRSEAEHSMVILSRRMMYYPLIQFFSRIVNAVYEQLYGFGAYSGDPAGSLVARQQFIMQCAACMTQPSAGIGFLVVFLIYQPYAREHMWALLTRCSTEDVTKVKPTSTFEVGGTGTPLDTNSVSLVDTFTAVDTTAVREPSSYHIRAGTEYDPGEDRFIDMDENDLMMIIHRDSMTARMSRKSLEASFL
jgi:hypothetical protein